MADVDPLDIEQFEADVQAMQWENVSLEPEPGWQDIEQELPEAWTQPLEPELAEEYSQEELQAFLDAPIDTPEGDIDANAEQALQELDLDLESIAQENTIPDIDLPGQEHEFDFGR